MPKHARLALTILFGALAPLACSSGGGGGTPGAAGTNNGAAGTNAAAGTNGAAGTNAAAGTNGAAGTNAAAGTNGAAGTNAAAGTNGAAGTGAAGTDTPPPRALNVTIAPGQHVHTIFGNTVGMDNRSAKMAGKLVVELGVDSGGYDGWLGKRGFHVFGVSFHHCANIDNWNAPYGRDYHMNCRFTTFDGVARGGAENDANPPTVTPDTSISGKVKAGLTMLKTMAPGEDWEYFLNADGSVRWSDVAFTGYSHGAQSAAAFGHLVRLYRAVSRSGPRDNNCGGATGFTCPVNLATPPYNAACPTSSIAAWQDQPFVTPIDRFYSFAGTMDSQFGDDQFSVEHMKYVGASTDIGKAGPYGTSHRFCAVTGHGGFETYIDAINTAFGVLPENLNPAF